MMIRFNQRRDEPLVCQCNGSPLGCNRWYARDRALTDRGKETCEWLGLFRWFWGESLWNVIRAFYSTRMHSQTICKASFRYILHGRIGHSG